ncbi:hypothetical protein [Chryseobacterium sp. CT-SW4]|uniref:hypothetical protein n=1 Tax=Chryseobacterium sp. SW-1 TaxID=3157343 RepID=UPI003B02B259
MKKIMLLAAFGVAGLVNAKNTTSLKGEEEKALKSKEIKANPKSQKVFKASVKLLKPQVWMAQTDCGWTATTTQDWTPAQANAWLEQLNANYCGG